MSGKRVSGSSHKKSIALVVSLALVLTAVLGVTIAYLTAQTPGVTNTFTPGQVSCKVEESIEGAEKKSIVVKNTSDTDVYIRIAVVANTLDSDGKTILLEEPTETICYINEYNEKCWEKIDDYYYYKDPVAVGGQTEDFTGVSDSIPLYENTQVTILAEAIQATGEVDGKTTTQYAWGVTIKDGSVASYTEPAEGGISG